MKRLWAICLAFCTTLLADPYEVVIVGGGPAGLTCGLYTARLGLKTLLIEGETSGGQLTMTHIVENFPGFVEGIEGPELVSNMRDQAIKYGALVKSFNATNVDFTAYPYKIHLSNSETVEAKSVVLATGSSPKLLGLASESALMGSGVSTCAVCDGFLYRGKDVVVVGGGDSAFEEALILSQFAKKVTLIHRSDQFRASTILKERVQERKNIELKTFREVTQILGKESVEGVVIFNKKSNQKESLACEGVFIAIGQQPNTEWLKNSVTFDEQGRIQETPKGVFAAGDLVDFRYKQAITAAGSGCKAALDAYQYLKLEEKK